MAAATIKMRGAGILRLTCLVVLFGLGLRPAAAQTPDRVLTTAAEVRSLSAAEAGKHYPVKLRGVVTFYDDGLFSRFVQDGTAGIYLQEMTNTPALHPGQLVEVEGVTGPGEFAPVVLPILVKPVGEGVIPDARPASPEALLSGREDSQLIAVSGVVRAVHFDKTSRYYQIEMVMGGERFTVYARQLPVANPNDLLASTLQVRGVCSTLFNHQRQLFGFRLLVPNAAGLAVEQAASVNPFEVPSQAINSLLQFTPQGTLDHRIKVSGTVVYYEPGNAIFIQDDKEGLRCQTWQRETVQPGDRVEILGSPAKGDYTPILEDAVYRKIGVGTEPKADEVDLNEVLTGTHDCRLVQLKATVLDRVDRGVNQFLLLEAGDFIFQAYLPQSAPTDRLANLVNGSEVLVTGICLIERGNNWEAGENWRAKSFRLLLRSANDVVVVQAPSGWSYELILGLGGAVEVVILVVIVWLAVFRKRGDLK